jgi:aconitate hydratase
MKETVFTDSFSCRETLTPRSGKFTYFSLPNLARRYPGIARFPYSIRVLLEAVLRAENGRETAKKDIEAFLSYNPKSPGEIEVPFKPARVLLQDFTGVPCVVDLAAMRSAVAALGGDPGKINPLVPVDLVIDHSLQIDFAASADAAKRNAGLEFDRNRERYEFLRWGQKAFSNFTVVPPGVGICHQVNLEYLATVVRTEDTELGKIVFPDSLVGTDSHTPMINGLGVLGWGVGGIEAEANMLGQPLYMLAPAVVGMRLLGRLREGVTGTDAVLTVTEVLRKKGVVNKFVEFIGPGAASLSVPDRALLANMAPEYGATMGFFPADGNTLEYLKRTGRPAELVELAEAYLKAQGLLRNDEIPEPEYESIVELDLADIEPSIAGPKRPQDRISLSNIKSAWKEALTAPGEKRGYGLSKEALASRGNYTAPDGKAYSLGHGAVIIASITSCTNTSNPSVMLAAGLLAKKAVEAGLSVKPWVKTSLAPGSRVVTDYLAGSGLLPYLEKLGFHVAGYGCATCIGNSGPVADPVASAVSEGALIAAAVLSGNRNFEGRVHPLTKANFLASPPLVVAYALAGTVDFDPQTEPLGTSRDGKPVFLKDLWPRDDEITALAGRALDIERFRSGYRGVEDSNEKWNTIPLRGGDLYEWNPESTYIREPPFFRDLSRNVPPIGPIRKARVLVMVGDSITTDHISPAGSIAKSGPAGKYLQSLGVAPADFNSYGARRGNDQVMTRGTFANIRLRNLLAQGTEGSMTIHLPSGETTDIFTAAGRYREAATPVIVIAGKDYGMGSSRDWAAKGVFLLGVKAVIAESYERIHRSNLVGMGVLPLQFLPGQNRENLGLSGKEEYEIPVTDKLRAGEEITVTARGPEDLEKSFAVLCRIDSPVEVDYYRNGGILQTVLRRLVFGEPS